VRDPEAVEVETPPLPIVCFSCGEVFQGTDPTAICVECSARTTEHGVR
jgi:Zn finger protein HypA/HybF involved in hydrogenase expression